MSAHQVILLMNGVSCTLSTIANEYRAKILYQVLCQNVWMPWLNLCYFHQFSWDISGCAPVRVSSTQNYWASRISAWIFVIEHFFLLLFLSSFWDPAHASGRSAWWSPAGFWISVHFFPCFCSQHWTACIDLPTSSASSNKPLGPSS